MFHKIFQLYKFRIDIIRKTQFFTISKIKINILELKQNLQINVFIKFILTMKKFELVILSKFSFISLHLKKEIFKVYISDFSIDLFREVELIYLKIYKYQNIS